jgi:hypothetical protein
MACTHASQDASPLHFKCRVRECIKGLMDSEMTEHYSHLSPDTRREAVGALDWPFAPACAIRATRMEEAANHP